MTPPGETAALYALEEEHWWYRGLRDALRRVVRLPQLGLLNVGRVLDAGCGSGEKLRLLRDLLAPRYLGGFDLSPVAVEYARQRLPGADIYRADLRWPEVHVDELDLVLGCDVCTAVGLEESRPGLQRLVERLRPGGWLILHEPALAWLDSGHDLAVGNRQRFASAQLRRLLESLHLEVRLLSYRVCLLLPAIAAARLPPILRRPREGAAASDVRACPRPLNRALESLLAAENRALVRGWALPWGSSVVALGQKARS